MLYFGAKVAGAELPNLKAAFGGTAAASTTTSTTTATASATPASSVQLIELYTSLMGAAPSLAWVQNAETAKWTIQQATTNITNSAAFINKQLGSINQAAGCQTGSAYSADGTLLTPSQIIDWLNVHVAGTMIDCSQVSASACLKSIMPAYNQNNGPHAPVSAC